jgi:hypothetical protein
MNAILLIEKIKEDGRMIREEAKDYLVYAKYEYIKELEEKGFLKPGQWDMRRNNQFRIKKNWECTNEDIRRG